MNKETSPYIKALVALILIAVIVLSFYVGFYLLRFLRDPEQFRAWIDSFGIYAPLVYLSVTALQIFVPMIPGEPMEMVAGYAFGSLEGTLLCFVGESIAGIIILLSCLSVFKDSFLSSVRFFSPFTSFLTGLSCVLSALFSPLTIAAATGITGIPKASAGFGD